MSRGSHLSRSLLCTTMLAALLFGGCAISLAQSDDEARIRDLENRFAEAFRAKDADRIMVNYEHSEDLVFFDVVTRNEYRGWEAYRKDWQSFFDSLGPLDFFEIKGLTVHLAGNMAYSYSFQHYRAQTKAGDSRDVTVRVTDVYRKRDRKWLIVHEHVSVPVNPQTGKGDFRTIPSS